MLDLLPGTDLGNVRKGLENALSTLTTARSAFTLIDRFNAYLTWANIAANVLRYQVSANDLDRLITTRVYWSMLGRNPTDFGSALPSLLDYEMQARDTALVAELDLFDADVAEWGNRRAVSVIPDTSALIELGGSFPELDWHDVLAVRSNVRILVVLTMAAVTELDGKKMSRDNSAQGQKVRAGVRGALRRIETLFPTNTYRNQHIGKRSGGTAYTVLLSDRLDHVPLPSADAEMISRGVAIQTYSGRSILVTFDVNQAFRSRAAGIDAHRLTYDYEAPEVDPTASGNPA
jgi:hypothetical protein